MSFTVQFLLFFSVVCFSSEREVRQDPPNYQIRTFANDGAWLWFNDQNIIVDNNTIYIGSESSQGYSKVDLYQVSGKGGKTTEYLLSTWTAKDDHNYPALLKLKNGDILATYSKNPSDKMYYRIANVSSDKSKRKQLNWLPEASIDLYNGMSYNNSIMLSGENNRIYNWYSIFTGSPAMVTSDDQGKSWAKDFSYMEAGKNHSSPYLKYASDGKERVDILYTDGHPRNEYRNNIYHIFYRKGQFFLSDGTRIRSLDSAKVNPMSPEEGTKIYDGGQQGPAWVWDIEYDRHKNPVAAYISSADGAEGNDLRYRYAKWDAVKQQWHEQQIAYAGKHLYVPENHFAGGITIDPENTNVVYISSNVDPYTGTATQDGRFQIYRGVTQNDGTTWIWKQLTFDIDQDNLRPMVPQNHHAKRCVFWFSGEYKSSLDFKTKIRGIFEK